MHYISHNFLLASGPGKLKFNNAKTWNQNPNPLNVKSNTTIRLID